MLGSGPLVILLSGGIPAARRCVSRAADTRTPPPPPPSTCHPPDEKGVIGDRLKNTIVEGEWMVCRLPNESRYIRAKIEKKEALLLIISC